MTPLAVSGTSDDDESRDIADACRVLAAGGIIAYPTEAVFGLGCDPANRAAVERLLALKQRPLDKGLILIAASQDQLQPWILPPDAAMQARLDATWPGAVTWLLPAAPDCPDTLRGRHDTLATRVTAHPPTQALCRHWGGALVSTSANRAGEEPARDSAAVRAIFGTAVAHVIDGPTGGATRPTPIRDARSGETLRD